MRLAFSPVACHALPYVEAPGQWLMGLSPGCGSVDIPRASVGLVVVRVVFWGGWLWGWDS